MVGPNAKGLSSDAAAVLTPVVPGSDLNKLGQPPVPSLGYDIYYDKWRYYFNYTLPHGFFSRSPMELAGRFADVYFPLSGFIVHMCYTSPIQAATQHPRPMLPTSTTTLVVMCCLESTGSLRSCQAPCPFEVCVCSCSCCAMILQLGPCNKVPKPLRHDVLL